MGIDYVSSNFASEYGLRNGLVLTGICLSTQCLSNGVSFNDLARRYSYLSKDQIREALYALKKDGAIESKPTPNEFTRVLWYLPSKKIMERYIKNMTEELAAKEKDDQVEKPVKPKKTRIKESN
jgi:DNA-binding HxlR family transcriptional regulator